jgi:uncharacterized membrane protein YfcA
MYLRMVSRRARILTFGSAGLLVTAGSLCGVLVGGLTGQLLTIALLSLGLGGAVLLAFLEVGLSEDRERARDEELKRKRSAPRTHDRPAPRTSQFRWPRRPS